MASDLVRIIRLATPEDAAGMARIYAPIVLGTAISFEMEPPTEEEFRRRITAVLAQWPWLVCECEGEVAGYAYASRHRERAGYQWSVESSVYVAEGHRGSGIARSLYRRLFRILEKQGYYNVYAGITLPNEASVALHESFGFTPVGVYRGIGRKLGAWHSVGWWELTLQDQGENEPAPPRSIAEFTESFGTELSIYA